MRARMSVAVLAGPRRNELVRVERPRPGPGEVALRLERCGVRGSSLAPWQGPERRRCPVPPAAPGREGWGVFVRLGEVEALAEARYERVALRSGAALAGVLGEVR